jgi:anti-sigma regulatory factor (Ser/Thr protein kinase)
VEALSAVSGSHLHRDAWLHVQGDSSVPAVRRRATELAVQAGFDEARVGEVGIAATEIATNLVKHAGEGAVVLRKVEAGGVTGVELISIDSGPGRRNIHALVADGESTAGTLGIGLGAVKRVAGGVQLHSVPGHGTVVAALLWPSSSRPPVVPVSGLVRPFHGQEVSGDTIAHRIVEGGHLVMVADGLGHGPLAAHASERAAEVFLASPSTAPGELVQLMHRALSGTRGAAVAVVRLDSATRTLVHAGVGNIAGRLVGEGVARSMVSQPGIVGHNLPRVRETAFDAAVGQAVVLHSDGLTEKWDLAALPGLLHQGPAVLAAALMRDAGTRRDDASLIVLEVAA